MTAESGGTTLFLDRILSKLDIELTSDKFDFDYEELLNTAGAFA